MELEPDNVLETRKVRKVSSELCGVKGTMETKSEWPKCPRMREWSLEMLEIGNSKEGEG